MRDSTPGPISARSSPLPYAATRPFISCGHSYGGALALEAARTLGPRVCSLTLIEPVAFHLLRLTSNTRSVADYRSITAPTRLVVGQRSPEPARAIVYELAHLLGDAHVRMLPQAGHMSPITHPVEIAALVAEHMDGCDAESTDGYQGNLNRASIA